MTAQTAIHIVTIEAFCTGCGKRTVHHLDHEYTDRRVRWEVYRCDKCGRTKRYAVA